MKGPGSTHPSSLPSPPQSTLNLTNPNFFSVLVQSVSCQVLYMKMVIGLQLVDVPTTILPLSQKQVRLQRAAGAAQDAGQQTKSAVPPLLSSINCIFLPKIVQIFSHFFLRLPYFVLALMAEAASCYQNHQKSHKWFGLLKMHRHVGLQGLHQTQEKSLDLLLAVFEFISEPSCCYSQSTPSFFRRSTTRSALRSAAAPPSSSESPPPSPLLLPPPCSTSRQSGSFANQP